MKHTKLVVKDNALIDAAFNLGVVEQKLLLIAMVSAREESNLTSSTQIEVTAAAYAEQYNLSIDKAYQTIKNAADTLFERRFSYVDRYKGGRLIKRVRWVSEIGYLDNKGLVVLTFSDTVISLISRLESQFSKYYLNQVSEFKSKFSIRLYEITVKWLSRSVTQKYEITELREKLGVAPSEYKTMSLFKTNVLDKAVKEINSKSDLNISYEQFKDGRTITHIQFKVQKKAITNKTTTAKTIKLTPKQLDMFADKLSRNVSFQQHYQANVGEEREAYAQRIAEKLADSFYVSEWLSFLIEVGFKPRYTK